MRKAKKQVYGRNKSYRKRATLGGKEVSRMSFMTEKTSIKEIEKVSKQMKISQSQLIRNFIQDGLKITKGKFKLVVKDSGSYTADSFSELIWIVIRHRFGHFFKGEGFID